MTESTYRTVPSCVQDLDQTFLPTAQMRQITRVTYLTDTLIVGEVDLSSTHWVFAQHFPDDPIFPGVLLIEAAGQLVALWAWADGQRGRPRLLRSEAEFHAPVGPNYERLVVRAEIRRKRQIEFATVTIHTAAQHVASIKLALTVLPALAHPVLSVIANAA